MTGPPILAVVHDEDIASADPLAHGSFDEEEAAIDGEVDVAEGDVGFDAGPLVLSMPARRTISTGLASIGRPTSTSRPFSLGR